MIEDKIRDIVEYLLNIESDKLPELTVKGIADRFYISYAHLSRSFVKSKGVYLKDFLRLMKLIRSIQMIYINPELKIEEIALKVGFEGPDSFRKAFRYVFGKNPSSFRKR